MPVSVKEIQKKEFLESPLLTSIEFNECLNRGRTSV